jgi:hypothetical protein
MPGCMAEAFMKRVLVIHLGVIVTVLFPQRYDHLNSHFAGDPRSLRNPEIVRSIPSFFILNCKVDRFKPSFEAAPFGPAILQPLASSACTISARSESRRFISEASGGPDILLIEGEGALGTADVGNGFGSTPSRARITARSTRFCSSRMLPGQEYDEKAAMVWAGMWRMCLAIRRLKISTKCSTSSGISTRRSRREGKEIGKTLSR